MIRYLLACLCLISFSAFAEDYNYGSSFSGGRYDSASAACSASAPNVYPMPPNRGSQGSITSNSGTSYYCNVTTQFERDGTWYDNDRTIVVDRRGDNCPEGATLDQAKGTCQKPESSCTAKKGTVKKSHWLSSTDEPSPVMSVDGCAAELSSGTICKTASPKVFSCSGTYTYTGDELKAGDTGQGSECTTEACDQGDPQDTSTNEPCIKQDTGAGFTCTAKVEDSKTGSTNCGTANGVVVCTPAVKPVKTTITSQVNQEQSANSDGSLTTKNVTTTTKTTCVADKCTETKYTTTTKGGTTKDGMPTGDSTKCEGTDCPSQTSGGGAGGGNSQSGEASASKDCSKPVVCKGDIYQCAVLNQEFISMCSLKEMPTSKDLGDLKASADKFAAAQATNQQELDQSANSVLNTFKSAASTGGGSTSKCLPDYNFAVAGHSFDMRFSSACETLAGIRYAILAIAYLLAIRRISMEL